MSYIYNDKRRCINMPTLENVSVFPDKRKTDFMRDKSGSHSSSETGQKCFSLCLNNPSMYIK